MLTKIYGCVERITEKRSEKKNELLLNISTQMNGKQALAIKICL